MPPDPTVWLHTGQGAGEGELGVSTPYGVVFLGLGARSGEVEFDVWFSDGPGTEIGIIEPLGETVAEVADGSAVLSGDVDPARVAATRGLFSFLADRRPDVYREL